MRPLRFIPILKRIRWGGTRLGTQLGKDIGTARDVAESWEVCDRGADQSVVRGGEYNGWTLAQLMRDKSRELLGQHAGVSRFPLLLKFLDANDRLSVQVHPNDVQAKQFDLTENGKTEAWVIIAADPGSRIYAGLKARVDQAALLRSLAEGTVEQCLHAFEVHAGDVIFIPAGTVHAIGEGVLLAEVQQSSDITFRLFDWGRLGPDGKPRPLHIDHALSCIDFTRGPIEKISPQAAHEAGHAFEELVRCPYFTLRRHTGPQSFEIPADDRCHLVMALHGGATCHAAGATELLSTGDTLLIPASSLPAQFTLDTTSILLEAFVP